ncbi:EscU/YscU/HrcU family type III secretion system export apparatus switch protein [Echinimonas agarilytica]|uniref:Flagellar biosynthetic protein FlhB n=1 Tax=Echinimonas agarilytica TaxID=1215918 RepID=A0AA41W5B7_9GAMM|nr:EscU/YscU/HrcU family type III secretion system export apparatus switch protein [Echinimonas agarilytica]MCM2678996.1 EscU/YscU/HrcU family type III secretion system export apparatus switch protein [Echinimonas agarilytica]
MSDIPEDLEPYAIALGYDAKNTPTVLAKGFAELAEQIVEIAEEEGIYIHKDAELARFLSHIEVGDNIPRELYVLVAEVISFAYLLEGKFPEQWAKLYNKISTQA